VSAVELAWALRSSFVAYVDALPDGVVAVEDGARREDGVFLLPGERAGDGHRFGGTIRFSGHLGVLDVELDGVEVLPGNPIVLRTVVSGVAVDLATARELEDDGDRVRSVDLRLTGDGAALLGGVYPPGERLDAFEIRAPQPALIH
jgi:hypothetical protein